MTMARRPHQTLMVVRCLERQGPMPTRALAQALGTTPVCMRALLSYMARRPLPRVRRVRPGWWTAPEPVPLHPGSLVSEPIV